MSLDERSAIYSAMASTLAALHSARVPSLLASKFGRLDNYCKRQVWRTHHIVLCVVADLPFAGGKRRAGKWTGNYWGPT